MNANVGKITGDVAEQMRQSLDEITDRLFEIRVKAEAIPGYKKWVPSTIDHDGRCVDEEYNKDVAALYNANTRLRLERGRLEKKRKDAERARDVWKSRLAEQQRDNEKLEEQQEDNERDRDIWKQRLAEHQEDLNIWKSQLEEQQKINHRLQEANAEIKRPQVDVISQISSQNDVEPPTPGLRKTAARLKLQEPQLLFAFRDIRQKIQDLVNSPLLNLDGVQPHINPNMEALKIFKSNDLQTNVAALEVSFGNFRTSSWTKENRKSRLKGLVFKELFHSIFNSDPWLGKMKIPGPLELANQNSRNTLARVAGRIVDILRAVQANPHVEPVALKKSALRLVKSAYTFRNQTGKSTPRYIVCDPFPEERTDWLKDCASFVRSVGFEGPDFRAEDALVLYTVFGGLFQLSETSSGVEECVCLEKVQVVLIQGKKGLSQENPSDEKVADEAEEEDDEL